MNGVLLKPSDYYSQRNNTVKPLAACMATARVMWLLANGITFRSPLGKQPEDYFMELLNSEEAIEFCRAKYPWSEGIPPNEVHGMYGSWLDERVTGKRRSNFLTNLSWDSYLCYLDNGHAIMTAGAFPTTDGHAVVAIGIREDRTALRLADPHGDWRTDYTDEHGYDVPLLRADFDRFISGDGSGKWGHVPWTD